MTNTWLKLVPEPHFDILVLGAGGGPCEDDLSCYFCKPKQANWSDGFTVVEGGSGSGALHRLMLSHPESFADFPHQPGGRLPSAQELCHSVKGYLITHAHFDHIAGLVLLAGSSPPAKAIYGTQRTIKNLQHVFDGGVWPALASFSSNMPYCYHTVSTAPDAESFTSSRGLEAFAMALSHGQAPAGDPYDSTAFFVGNEATGHHFLFFGDVDADSVAGDNRNQLVWQRAAPLILAKRLSSIFIECSYTSDRPRELLYGHLSPPYLFEELQSLVRCLHESDLEGHLPDRRPLQGINILIIHVKGCGAATETRQAIAQELSALEEQHQTGAHFVVLEQGMRIEI